MHLQRSAGVLLHPTSLPGLDGIGDVGPQAYRWIDWLADNSARVVERISRIDDWIDAVADPKSLVQGWLVPGPLAARSGGATSLAGTDQVAVKVSGIGVPNSPFASTVQPGPASATKSEVTIPESVTLFEQPVRVTITGSFRVPRTVTADPLLPFDATPPTAAMRRRPVRPRS